MRMNWKCAAAACCLCAVVASSPPCAGAAEAPAGAALPAGAQAEENDAFAELLRSLATLGRGGSQTETDRVWRLSDLWESVPARGFVTVNGAIRYATGEGRDDYEQFAPGFVTVDGRLCHVEADGFTFTNFPAGFSVVDGLVCYSNGGPVLETFTPGFVTIGEGLYYVMPDGYSFQCHTAGLYTYGDDLYCVAADGAAFLTNGVWNGLEFGPDGRYTSGSAQLDSYVKQVLAQCTNDAMTQEQKLRAAYNYVRDHGRYLARSHRARGSVDWTMEEALFFFENNRGNCYSFAGAFLYLARQLGYQASPVSGGVGYDNKDHAWVTIPWSDGVTYLFDVELEYAYRYRYENKRNLDLFKMTSRTAPFVYTFPQ